MLANNSQTVELKVFTINQDILSYKYTNGTICLFITAENNVNLPMGNRSIPLPQHAIYLFYDQQRNFELSFTAEQQSSLIVIRLTIDTLHHIIATGTDEINFSQSALFEKEQYHHFEQATDEIKQCITVILENQNNIFLQEAKKYELLNYYFTSKNVQTYQCPFLNQKDNVTKVRDAKKELIADLTDSPTIKELAKKVGLNEYNLKTGFKEIYGKPIHAYLKDYKMIKAKEMLLSREKQVNEIADNLGYSNVSHFIEAFKKKYGHTPKQFELHL